MLNKTNLRTLRGAFGDDTANWVGKVIVVFPTMVDVRGKTDSCAAGADSAAEAAGRSCTATAGNARQRRKCSSRNSAAAVPLPRRACRRGGTGRWRIRSSSLIR